VRSDDPLTCTPLYAVSVRRICTCYMYVQEGYIIHIGQQVTVRSGDTLDKLAARFGTTLRQVSFLFFYFLFYLHFFLT